MPGSRSIAARTVAGQFALIFASSCLLAWPPTMTTQKAFKYDCGISFLNVDMVLARSLYEGLSPNFSVFFFFSDCQQEISGNEGLGNFLLAFRDFSLALFIFSFVLVRT